MRYPGAVVSVGLACVLAIAAAFVFRTPADGPQVARALISVLPGQVAWLEVEHAGGRVDRLERREGAWMIRAGEGGPWWPADEGRVRAGLRVLASYSAAPIEPDPAKDATGGPIARIGRIDDEPIEIRFAAASIGGRRWAAVGSHGAWVSGDLVSMLTSPGISVWRDTRAFRPPSVGFSGIRVVVGDAAVALRRSGRTWTIVEPVLASADAEAAENLLSQLSAVTIARFAEPGADTLGARPVRLELEWIERSVEGDQTASRRPRQVLELGGPADLAQETVYARVRAEAQRGDGTVEIVAGPLDAIVPIGSLTDVQTDVAAYLARVALPGAGADVAWMRLSSGEGGSVELERGIDGWRVTSDQTWPGVEQVAPMIVALVSTVRADSARLSDSDAQGLRFALSTAADRPVAFEGSVLVDGNALTLDGGGVRRVYAGDAVMPIVQALKALGQ